MKQKTVQIQLLYARQMEKYIIDAVNKYKNEVPEWVTEEELVKLIMHMQQEKIAKRAAIIVMNEAAVSHLLGRVFKRMRDLSEILYKDVGPNYRDRMLRSLKRMDLALNLLNNQDTIYFYNLKYSFNKKMRLGGVSMDNPLIQSILEELDSGVPIRQIKDARLLLEATNLGREYSRYLKKIQNPRKEYLKKWREKNTERLKKYSREYYLLNKKRLNRHNKQYWLRNKEKLSEDSHKLYLKNREKRIKKQRRYYEENKEKVKERQRICYLKKKEYYKQKQREFFQRNREYVLERNRQYRLKNRDKIREMNRKYQAKCRKKLKGKNS